MNRRSGTVVIVVLAMSALTMTILMSVWRYTSLQLETARIRERTVKLEDQAVHEWRARAKQQKKDIRWLLTVDVRSPSQHACTARGYIVPDRSTPGQYHAASFTLSHSYSPELSSS